MSDQIASLPGHDVRIAGFWRRFGAILADSIVLFIVGWVLGNALADSLIRWPLLGLLLGPVFALGYEALLEGRPGRGQTLGKMLLGIKVVDINGRAPAPRSAWTRTAYKNAFVVVNILNYLLTQAVPITGHVSVAMVVAILLFLLVLGPFLIDIYWYLVDDQGRQSVHDRLAGTWVVRKDNVQPPARSKPLWQGHYVIVAVLLAGIGTGVYGITQFALRLTNQLGAGNLKAVLADHDDLTKLVETHPEWQLREVNARVIATGGGKNAPPNAHDPVRATTVMILPQMTTKTPPANHVAVSRALARRMLALHPELRAQNGTIDVVYGYAFSLGFYNQAMITVEDTQSIADWQTDKEPKSSNPFGHFPFGEPKNKSGDVA